MVNYKQKVKDVNEKCEDGRHEEKEEGERKRSNGGKLRRKRKEGRAKGWKTDSGEMRRKIQQDVGEEEAEKEEEEDGRMDAGKD